MEHTPEHQSPPPAKVTPETKELAAAYARVFLGTDDGRRILRDLRRKFGLKRLCFEPNGHGRFDYLAAAITDGERRVLLHIEGALFLANPDLATLHEEKP